MCISIARNLCSLNGLLFQTIHKKKRGILLLCPFHTLRLRNTRIAEPSSESSRRKYNKGIQKEFAYRYYLPTAFIAAKFLAI